MEAVGTVVDTDAQHDIGYIPDALTGTERFTAPLSREGPCLQCMHGALAFYTSGKTCSERSLIIIVIIIMSIFLKPCPSVIGNS